MALAAVRGGALSGGWWGPAAATGGGGGGAQQQQQQQQQRAGKKHMLDLKDCLRLMAAEVALTQGKAEDAAKHLKSMLSRCVGVFMVVVLVCVCVGGGVVPAASRRSGS
jgi:hypothetical protein